MDIRTGYYSKYEMLKTKQWQRVAVNNPKLKKAKTRLQNYQYPTDFTKISFFTFNNCLLLELNCLIYSMKKICKSYIDIFIIDFIHFNLFLTSIQLNPRRSTIHPPDIAIPCKTLLASTPHPLSMISLRPVQQLYEEGTRQQSSTSSKALLLSAN